MAKIIYNRENRKKGEKKEGIHESLSESGSVVAKGYAFIVFLGYTVGCVGDSDVELSLVRRPL